MAEKNLGESAALNDTTRRSADTLQLVSLILVCAGIAASVVIGVTTTRSIVRPDKKADRRGGSASPSEMWILPFAPNRQTSSAF